jgi:hypothetical protein
MTATVTRGSPALVLATAAAGAWGRSRRLAEYR